MTRLLLPVLAAAAAAAAVAAGTALASPYASHRTFEVRRSTTATLDDVCTESYVKDSLPAHGFNNGIVIDYSSISATPVTGYNVEATDMHEALEGTSFCNVTFSYKKEGYSDVTKNVWYYMPAPKNFKNRYLTTGGGGYMITSGSTSLDGGLVYGAVAGTTDGGLGSWSSELSDVILRHNGSLNYEHLFDFAYRALHELTLIGKHLSKKYYNATKVYSYYQGCSEGGREGWSQVQRYGDAFDGAAIGAPAFRQAFQQVNHLLGPITQKKLNYVPSDCEFDRINNDTIAACDELDGRKDGVVSRSDLCFKHYNASQSIGNEYYCAASSGSSGGMGRRQMGGGASTPEQSGKVSAEAAAVVTELWAGLHDSRGRRVYVPFQKGASFADAEGTYDADAGAYVVGTSGIGAQWVQLFLNELNTTSFSSSELDAVDADTLRTWMLEGYRKFADTMQTTWPDLEDARAAGAKIIHYHGEADNSIPTMSSVRYYEAVRGTMYPHLSANESYAHLDEWYRLFLIPGAAHCQSNPDQPNGPFPQTVLGSVIDWVERGVNPRRLNATVINGTTSDVHQKVCSWPLRPQWTRGGTEMECVYDQYAIEEMHPQLDAIPVPVP